MYVLFFLILLSIIITFFYFYIFSKEKNEVQISLNLTVLSTKSPREQRAYLSERIQSHGAGSVYQEFKTAAALNAVGTYHRIAHAFGEALYDVAGTQDVGVCDDAFEFGCYHGFFGEAINQEGLSVIAKFNAACRAQWGEKYLPCHHGIGHGILAYTGFNSLVKALDLCKTISSEPTGGCVSGVIMGYNFRNPDHSDTVEIRPVERNNLQLPCEILPREFLPACYGEQPQWWLAVLGNDVKKIGVLCSEASMSAHDACFHGVGNFIAPAVQFDVAHTITACDGMPSSEGRGWCREGASWIFLAQSSTRDKAPELCHGLGQGAETICIQKIISNPFWEK